MPLLRGIAHTCSVRPWRVWNYRSLRAYLVQVSEQRGTCLVERPAKGGLSVTAPESYYTGLSGL